MKQLKSVLALILALALLVSCFAACGGNDSGSAGDSSGSSESSPVDSEPSESNESSEDGADEGETNTPASDVYEGEVNGQTYPLTEEKVTLTMWYPNAGSMGELADFNDGEFWKWYEEKTNVHIDFIVPASGSESDAFQLLFASSDMPDMIEHNPNGQKYRGGEDAAIEDGYFVDVAEHLDWVPNYVSWLHSHEDWGKACYSDTGKLYAMWGVWRTINPEGALADQGLSIRKDFVDKVKMEVPTTYDEWETVLTAFKDQLGIEAPFYTSKYGIDNGEFMAGYDTAPYFYQRDGKVQYGPMDDQYRDYLGLLHDWWEKGLLDKDFATRTSGGITADNDMMLNDKVGSLVDYGTRMSDTYITRGATNPDFYTVAAPQPKKSAGDPDPAWRMYDAGSDRMTTRAVSFNAESENLELAMRWNDGFYAEDIFLNANYGLEEQEGTVWFAAEDGHRIGDYDFRYSNPDGISSATVLVQFWTKNPPVRVEAAQIEQSDQNKQDSYQVWSQYEPTHFLPVRLTNTAEEGTQFASKYTDIETYVQECNVKFIMGQMSLDDYDSYRDTLKNMGIEDCIALKQAALDRYNAREMK